MKTLLLILAILVTCTSKSNSQRDTGSPCPTVAVTVTLAADTFKFGTDISVVITLTNKSTSVQSVWFDKPKHSTGGPAWTSVTLINKVTGKSVLLYENKAVLESQTYSSEQVKDFSYQLKPGQSVSGQFSLYDLVVLLGHDQKLEKGNYEMQIFYCFSSSNQLNFTVN